MTEVFSSLYFTHNIYDFDYILFIDNQSEIKNYDLKNYIYNY